MGGGAPESEAGLSCGDPCAAFGAGVPLDTFRHDGFVRINRLVSLEYASLLARRLDCVLQGEYDTGLPPDKRPKGTATMGQTVDRRCTRTLHLINVWKSDSFFARLARSPALGELVAKLAGWSEGTRLAQDQVWAKPPGSPPIVFHLSLIHI